MKRIGDDDEKALKLAETIGGDGGGGRRKENFPATASAIRRQTSVTPLVPPYVTESQTTVSTQRGPPSSP